MRSHTDSVAVQPDRADGEQAERCVADPSAALDALRGRTILVADANAQTRELYRVFLQSAGVTVIDVQDGRDALVKTFGANPDAIVADSELPYIDGLELCRLLRVDAATARLPVILITASPLTALGELWRAGANAAFAKPFPPESLLTELAQLVRSGRHAEGAGAGLAGDGALARDRRRRRIRNP